MNGDKVFFLTGTDEHGEKIEQAAVKSGETPKAFTDHIVTKFIGAWEKMGISYDCFMRTTEPRHEAAVTEFIRRIWEHGDIYKGEYEGWYCTPDETFWTEQQIKGGKCPECGREVKKMKEDAYFFRLSSYGDRLLEMYSSDKGFLSPESRAQEIINRVRGGLKDLCITRTTVTWAIPFQFEKGHYLYVWVDALINYLSALDWPDGAAFKELWPADLHMVGKEINWFHSVIWPAMLMSAGIAPPRMVFAHGWWTVNGEKMSKSLGNSVDPVKMAEKYSADSLRYFLVREMPLGEDGDFSEEKLAARINGELVSDLGNLLYRVLTLAERFEGKIEGADELGKEVRLDEISRAMNALELHTALELVWAFIKSANKYVNEKKVWELKGAELSNALYNLLEACRVISILIAPFMPATAEEMARQLGTSPGALKDCTFREFAGKVRKGAYLFQKVEV
jgi:methionyl-tRNA synthetase